MVSVLASSVVDLLVRASVGSKKDYKIGMCCFSAKHAESKNKNKAELARNQENM